MRTCLIPLLFAGLGCAPRHLVLDEGPSYNPRGQTVAVAPTQVLAELPAVATEDPFEAGLTVGHVHHAGGYELRDVPTGVLARSKSITVNAADDYAEQVRAWVDDTVSDALLRRGTSWVRAEGFDPEAFVPPRQSNLRGTTKHDGNDNLNLPRFQLRPEPLPAEARQGIEGDVLLVPMVVYYYSHNGGWFIGQRKGSSGGARFRLHWAVYDLGSGTPLSWMDQDARLIAQGNPSPTTAQIGDYLAYVEEQVERQVRRRLLR